MDSELRAAWAVFAIAAGLAAALAIGVGIVIGLVVGKASAADCTPSDGWCDLGAAILGLVAGVAAGAITYIVVGVLAIRRLRPNGHRAGPVVAHLAAPPVLLLTLQLIALLFDAIT